MRITWSDTDKCFEAEFVQGGGWQRDLDSAKEAGFKTVGAPSWRWQAFTIKPLDVLRQYRPESGLMISPEALQHYQQMRAQQEANEAVLAPLKAAKLEAKKTKVKIEREGEKTPLIIPEGKWCIDACDLPPLPARTVSIYPKPKPFEFFCSICQDGLDDIWDDRVFLICMYCENS